MLKKLNHSHILPIRDAGIGRKPFMVEGVQIEAVQYQHAKVTPVAPTQLNPHLPMHIEQAILTAMAKDRTNRHSDIAVFVSALHKSKTQWLAEGDAHYDAKRYEEALLAYEQALHLDPNDAAVYFKKGNILSKLKRYEEALAAYEQALRLNPNDAVAYNNKGNAFYRLKRYEEALAACEQALRLALNSALDEAIAYNNTSLTLERLGRFREAQQAREKARQLGYKG